jgi:threonylcarbamoyladenosine tRNA methylthiotransferase MtaB
MPWGCGGLNLSGFDANSNTKRVAIATLGCKANQFDSEAMREDLERKGFRVVSFDQTADVYIVNTCTVTAKSDYQSRQLARRAHRLNPEAIVVATGCYAEVFPDEVGAVQGVSAVLGNQAKQKISALLLDLIGGKSPKVWIPPVSSGALNVHPIDRFDGHCRAFLKIQDGCDAGCSYCIVPRARGKSRSLPPPQILEQVAELGRRGFMEVVLTGIHLGSYGLDLSPPTSLTDLLEILEHAPHTPPRIRLSSVEPTEVPTDLLLRLGDSRKICPHLHIPLQSGDDEVLARMNRKYTRKAFRDLISEITDRIPSVCIGLDVMGGFPGEEESHFQNTLDLIEELPVAYLHVFPFSPRPGTPASDMPQKVGKEEVRRRCQILRNLGQMKRQAFHTRFLHRRVQVLEEEATFDGEGRRKSVSRNYIPVWIERAGPFTQQEVEVEITEVRGQKVLGRRV